MGPITAKNLLHSRQNHSFLFIFSIMDALGKHFLCVYVPGTTLDVGSQAVGKIHTLH